MERKGRLSQKGVSLFELLAVIALITLILFVTMPELYTWYQNYRVQTAVSEVRVHLLFARNAAVKRKLQYRVAFNVADDPDTYRILYNPSGTFTAAPGYLEKFKMPSGVSFDATKEVTFDSRGAALPGALQLQIEIATTGTRYQVDVSTTGAVSSKKL